MRRIPEMPVFLFANEARRRVLTRFGTSHHVEIQQTVEAHAYPDRPALQPIFEAVLFRLHEVPFFWFAGVFGRIGSRVVCSMQGVKRHDIDARRREHSEVDIVRHDELVVFG